MDCVCLLAGLVAEWRGRHRIAARLEGIARLADPAPVMAESGRGSVFFASGTTGAPKGGVLSRQALLARMETLSRVLQVDGEARIFNGLSVAHADGTIQGPLPVAASGGRVLRPRAFQVQRSVEDLTWVSETDATHWIAAPAVFDMLDRPSPDEDLVHRRSMNTVCPKRCRPRILLALSRMRRFRPLPERPLRPVAAPRCFMIGGGPRCWSTPNRETGAPPVRR